MTIIANRWIILLVKEGVPKMNRFDEKKFFQTNSDLHVSSDDLELHVGLEERPTRGALAFKSVQVLMSERKESALFGRPGSKRYEKTLKRTADLGQIAELIAADIVGSRLLLRCGRGYNLFPVLGKNDVLCVGSLLFNNASDRWNVTVNPCRPDHKISKGSHIFWS